MTVREHNDKHFGKFYAWMVGDFASRQQEFLHFLVAHDITSTSAGVAVDMGAGHGLRTVLLARQNFAVTANDFESALLQHFQS